MGISTEFETFTATDERNQQVLDEITPIAAEGKEKLEKAGNIFKTVKKQQNQFKKSVNNFKKALAKVVSKQETVEQSVEELTQRLQVVGLGLEMYRANPPVKPLEINGTVYSTDIPIGNFFSTWLKEHLEVSKLSNHLWVFLKRIG